MFQHLLHLVFLPPSSTLMSSTTTEPFRRRPFTHERGNTSPESSFSLPPSHEFLSDSEEDAPRAEHASIRRPATTAIKRNVKAWYEFDRTVLLVLLSPVGSWLTGNGEWMRDLILVVLGVYYLHQIIEVPWNLYMSSLPPSTSNDEPEARKELRRIELFLLACTVLSPFAGTLFLKYILSLITGNHDALSWFSTSLFVLTCGVRPWRHLSDRIDGRVSYLQSTLQPPTPPSPQGLQIEEELADLRVKMRSLEECLRRETEALHANVDELEAHARKGDRKWEKHHARLTKNESSLAAITRSSSENSASLVSRLTGVSSFIPAAPRSSVAYNLNPPRPRGTKRHSLETIPEESKVGSGGGGRTKTITKLRQRQSPIAIVLEALFSLALMPFWPAVWIVTRLSSIIPGLH